MRFDEASSQRFRGQARRVRVLHHEGEQLENRQGCAERDAGSVKLAGTRLGVFEPGALAMRSL